MYEYYTFDNRYIRLDGDWTMVELEDLEICIVNGKRGYIFI